MNLFIKDAIVDGIMKGDWVPIVKHLIAIGAIVYAAEEAGLGKIWDKFLFSFRVGPPIWDVANNAITYMEEMTEAATTYGFNRVAARSIHDLGEIGLMAAGAPTVAARRARDVYYPTGSTERREKEDQYLLPFRGNSMFPKLSATEKVRRLMFGQTNQTQLNQQLKGLRYHGVSNPDTASNIIQRVLEERERSGQ